MGCGSSFGRSDLFVLEWVLGNLPGFIAVLLAFGFIIFIHESGHFLMARKVGIRCPRFSLGFGPRLFSFDSRGTEFSVCALPFGVSCRCWGGPRRRRSSRSSRPSRYLPEEPCGNPRQIWQPCRAGRRFLKRKRAISRRSAIMCYLPVGATDRQGVGGNFNDKTILQLCWWWWAGHHELRLGPAVVLVRRGSVWPVDLTPNSAR